MHVTRAVGAKHHGLAGLCAAACTLPSDSVQHRADGEVKVAFQSNLCDSRGWRGLTPAGDDLSRWRDGRGPPLCFTTHCMPGSQRLHCGCGMQRKCLLRCSRRKVSQ